MGKRKKGEIKIEENNYREMRKLIQERGKGNQETVKEEKGARDTNSNRG